MMGEGGLRVAGLDVAAGEPRLQPPPGSDAFLVTLFGERGARDLCDRATRLGVPINRLILREGWIEPARYVDRLAAHHDVDWVARAEDAAIGAVAIDATGQAPDLVAISIAAARGESRDAVLFIAAGTRSIAADEAISEVSVADAIRALRSAEPEMSAGRRMWFWQYVVAALAVGAFAGIAFGRPEVAGRVVLFASAGLFAVVAAFRLLLLATLVTAKSRAWVAARPRLSDHDLPTYAVLVPLYREAAVLPDLVEALTALDYPAAKLDIVLILEGSDRVTQDAVAGLAMPAFMRHIVVPDRQPRTKPKALDMALGLTESDLVAVYDAEDVPARDQLRTAAAAFAASRGRVECVQARLAVHNPRQSWLTRQFAIEYATLFHTVLPGLSMVGLTLPLSGTSNHFRRSVLEVTAWDPYNVTEDADLGVRLARRGVAIGLIDSATFEEAPPTWRQWLPQRTRWIKGWLQTYLVHCRQPLRLLRELGVWRYFGFHALFGGFLLSVLAYPALFAVVAFEFSRPEPFSLTPGSAAHLALSVALVDLAVGIVAALVMALAGLRRARLGGLVGDVLAAPLYWLLVSFAGYRALIQFIVKPHLWEKTEHAARRQRGRRPWQGAAAASGESR